MTAQQTTTSDLRPALERLARKWTLTLPGGAPNRYHFFGDGLTALLANTSDSDLDVAAEALADSWGNAVPEGHAIIRAYFAFDVKQAVKTSRAE